MAARLRREDGVALAMVVLMISFLTLISIGLIQVVSSESARSARAVTSSAAFQAAEAGVDDYLAKLVDDGAYYLHRVHVAESTRRPPAGADVPAGSVWTYSRTWTYPNGRDAWKQLPNGYEYNLQITPPSPGSQEVQIVSTGRRIGSTTDMRTIEAGIRPSSIADFQMLANNDIVYGVSATTYGKIYAGIDSSGTRHNVTHFGTAYANIYAEGSVLGPPTLRNGARTYDRSTIRTQIKNPINFQSFLASLVDIERAARLSGRAFDNPAVSAWYATFRSGGTFDLQQCTRSGSSNVAAVRPVCGAATSYTVPANGAVYFAQTVIVEGQVQGRVTVASNDNVVIARDIGPVTPGTDVLGLIASNDMIIAEYAPATMSWRAGTLAQNGLWRSWSGSYSHVGTMTFTGSTATNQGGYMSMFTNRVYNYDDTLLYLPPPWFPTVDDAYTVSLFREITP